MSFFDYFVIAFVLAFIVGPWELSYGQSAIVLLSSGLGAIIGGFFWEYLADRFGQRPTFIATILCFSVSTGIMYFTPEGGWIFLSMFRFLVGFGVGGLYSIDLPLVQEFVPSRYRVKVGGIVTTFIPVGMVMGSVLAAYLIPHVGWRSLFLVGLIPAALTLLIRAWVPESPRWLISRGRYQEAEKAILWTLGTEKTFLVPTGPIVQKDRPIPGQARDHGGFMELFKYPRSLIISWGTNIAMQTGDYAVLLWGPTLLAMVLGVPPAVAAKYYIAVSLGSVVGRWFWSFGSDWFGRRYSGFAIGMLAGIGLFLAAIYHNVFLGSISAFWPILICANFCVDSGFAIVGPYASEVWPNQLKCTGMGSAYGFGGLGKILGPAALALFAGSSDIVSPKATMDAIIPAFTFLALMARGSGVLYLFGWETKGKTIEEIDCMVGSRT